VSYELTKPGFVIVWQDEFKAAVVYGPIAADAIQDFIDSYPDDDHDDVIGYSASETAAELGALMVGHQTPPNKDGDLLFWVNDANKVGQDGDNGEWYRLTLEKVMKVGNNPVLDALADDLLEMDSSSAIYLEAWPNAAAFLEMLGRKP